MNNLASRFSLLCVFSALAISGCASEEGTGDNPVTWDTNWASLHAADFFIEADGVRFYGTQPMDVDGDPGDAEYMSLELEWQENGAEMRLYMYLSSDGAEWWCDEIRTYDGAIDDGTSWVYYYGDFFRTPVGQSFQGDLDITASEADNDVDGRLYFANVEITAF